MQGYEGFKKAGNFTLSSGEQVPGELSFDLSPPPLVEDPDRFYRSGEK